jgi:hypothetical protein
MTIHSKQSGYTLLFAVLVSVLVLGVAVFISGIARKQYILSSTALDSMYSFYAADSGIECVAYGPNFSIASTTATGTSLTCNGQTINTPTYNVVSTPSFITNANGSVNETTFNLGWGPLLKPWGCANISIYIYNDNSGGTDIIIQSRGYNICKTDFTPDTSSPRTVERALQWSTIQ